MSKTPKELPRSKRFNPLHADLLGFFYPIHYRVGMELETRMCQGRVSRQQAAIICQRQVAHSPPV